MKNKKWTKLSDILNDEKNNSKLNIQSDSFSIKEKFINFENVKWEKFNTWLMKR